MITAKKFTILSVLAFLLITTAYMISVEVLAIPKRTVDKTYRHFLLRASDRLSNKILIDSGSNSVHAVDAQLVEHLLNRFTLSAADNAAYPLEYKIYAFEQYLNRGDTVILPLEWTYYVYESIPFNFIKPVFSQKGFLSFYYWHLPFITRMHFILRELPFSIAAKHLLHQTGLMSIRPDIRLEERGNLEQFSTNIDFHERGSILVEHSENRSDPWVGCDPSILPFYGVSAKNFYFSKRFIENLKHLNRIAKQKGVQFIFTWPATVTYDEKQCYTSPYAQTELPLIAQKIKNMVKQYGFHFVGDYKKTGYDKSCYFNTVYHILKRCSGKRTRYLVKELIKDGLKKNTTFEPTSAQVILKNYLSQLENKINVTNVIHLNTRVKANDFLTSFSSLSGWDRPEIWDAAEFGMWSIGYKSTIQLNVAATQVSSIIFTGRYFPALKKTGVVVNGVYLGDFDLRNQKISLKKIINLESNILNIELIHHDPMSPVALNLSKDDRKIQYGLSSLELKS